jgi:hypothetical protein
VTGQAGKDIKLSIKKTAFFVLADLLIVALAVILADNRPRNASRVCPGDPDNPAIPMIHGCPTSSADHWLQVDEPELVVNILRATLADDVVSTEIRGAHCHAARVQCRDPSWTNREN